MKKKEITYKALYCQAIVIFCLVASFTACQLSGSEQKQHPIIGDLKPPMKSPSPTVDLPAFDGNYAKTFNDLHKLHTEEAEKLGFRPMATHQDTARLKGQIIYLHPGEYENFVIDSLPHSIPIMIPEVAKLINEIGANFRDSLKTIDFPDSKIIVTSITRTEADIKKLRRRNANAVHESTHRHGTSFDISWIRFHKVDTTDTRTAYQRIQKRNLGKVLNRMSLEKKCYVKYETQQMCFHITIREQ